METVTALPILLRLSQVIDAFVAGMWNYRMPRHDTPWGVIPAIDMSLLNRVRTRMYLAERALKSLMLRFRAGKLRPPAPRGPQTKPRTRTRPKQKPLRGNFGWFCPLMPSEAAIRGNHLMLVLAEPEMQELLVASPRARAILKPICRMLAIEPTVLYPKPQPAIATLPHAEIPTPAPAPNPAPTCALPSVPPRDYPLLVPG